MRLFLTKATNHIRSDGRRLNDVPEFLHHYIEWGDVFYGTVSSPNIILTVFTIRDGPTLKNHLFVDVQQLGREHQGNKIIP